MHSLNLSGCVGVVDVSALGGVHSLNLSGCVGVVDVSALGGVHSLTRNWWNNQVMFLSRTGSASFYWTASAATEYWKQY